MSSVSEWIVREYFEMLGYMVSQPCKYHVGGRPKRPGEEIDLLVVNPSISAQRIPDTILWTSNDLNGIARAAVAVCGWHTERIYTAMLDQMPEILGFVGTESLALAARKAGTTNIAKIICLPRLPASKKLMQQILLMLKKKGVDGVLLFRTMLLELMNRVDVNRNYEKSDLLQIIRLLKNYDLLKDPQMDLFSGAKRRKPRAISLGKEK